MSAQRKAIRAAMRRAGVSRRNLLKSVAGLAASAALPAWSRAPRGGTTAGGGGGALAIVGGNQTLSNATVGSVFSANIAITGGTPPYSVTKTADTTTCNWPQAAISGNNVNISNCWPVAVESQSITVQVQDSASNTASATLTIPTKSRPGFVPNITALTPFASGTANTAAYTALNVPAMLAGTSYTDPSTGMTVWKVTQANAAVGATFPSAVTPVGNNSWGWCNEYSTLGLQISQAWGPSLNKYTIFFINTPAGGPGQFLDYTLGGTFSNSRTAPAGEGDWSFSRLPGEAQIGYYNTSTKLNRYDTAAMALANTGSYPYTWATSGGSGGNFLQFNRLHTWATAAVFGSQQPNNFTALKIGNTPDSPVADGTVRTVSTGVSINEGASGYQNDAVFLDGTGTTSWVFNLDANTITNVTVSSSFTTLTHEATLPGYWSWYDSENGGGVMLALKISDAGVFSHTNTISAYYGSMHNSGHWTQSAAATSQYTLTSVWKQGTPSQDNAHLDWNSVFIDANSSGTGGIFTLCGHYSRGADGTPNNTGYRAQPHTTISDDGLIAMFTSCMFLGTNSSPGGEVELFLVELPKVAG